LLENKQMIKVLLSNPRGFCAGVDRAIEIIERWGKTHPEAIQNTKKYPADRSGNLNCFLKNNLMKKLG